MSMEIRKDYVNPLAMMKTKSHQKLKQITASPKNQTNKVKELQNKQQQLQNALLLMKCTGSDSNGMSPKTQKVLEEKLEEVSLELQTAKSELPEEEETPASFSSLRPRKDFYEKEGHIPYN